MKKHKRISGKKKDFQFYVSYVPTYILSKPLNTRVNNNKNLNIEARDHATSTGHNMKWDHFETLARWWNRESRIESRIETRNRLSTYF